MVDDQVDAQASRELTRCGHKVSADTVGDLLREEGFLQGNAKTIEGKQHPDRDAQFQYVNDHAKQYQGPAPNSRLSARTSGMGSMSASVRPSRGGWGWRRVVRHRRR